MGSEDFIDRVDVVDSCGNTSLEDYVIKQEFRKRVSSGIEQRVGVVNRQLKRQRERNGRLLGHGTYFVADDGEEYVLRLTWATR